MGAFFFACRLTEFLPSHCTPETKPQSWASGCVVGGSRRTTGRGSRRWWRLRRKNKCQQLKVTVRSKEKAGSKAASLL